MEGVLGADGFEIVLGMIISVLGFLAYKLIANVLKDD